MNRLRFWIVVFMLAGTVLIQYARSSKDRIPPRRPLSQLPNTISGWIGTDVAIDQATLDVLGAGDFLSRSYTAGGQVPPVDLFIAYLPTQRTGDVIHSPKRCLPGAGWTFELSSYVDLKDAGGKLRHVGEYVITNGQSRDFVIYWYESNGHSVANEYIAKAYLGPDAMLKNRTDGALVRIITPIGANEGTPQARARAETFTAQLAPMLSRFIPD